MKGPNGLCLSYMGVFLQINAEGSGEPEGLALCSRLMGGFLHVVLRDPGKWGVELSAHAAWVEGFHKLA